MIQGPDYIFAIQDKDFRFWKMDSSGNVFCSAQPYFLNYSPIGWHDIEVDNIRNKKYWGVERSVSSTLSHVEDAAKILKYIFYTKGNEEPVYFVIAAQKLVYTPGVEYGFWYKKIFRGEVDLADFVHNGVKVTAKSLEEGLVKYLKSNENTTFEFPMNVPEAIDVVHTGINLHNYVENLVSDGISSDPNYDFGNHILDIQIVKEDAPYVFGKKSVPRTKVNNINADISATDEWFEKSSIPSPIQFNYNFPVRIAMVLGSPVTPGAVFKIVVRALTPAGVFSSQVEIFTQNLSTDYSGNFTVAGSGTITANADDELFLYGFCNVTGATGDGIMQVTYNSLVDSFFNYSYLYQNPATTVKYFTGQYLFNELIKKLTENNYQAATSAYFTKYKQKLFTCGNALRGLADAVMKISFADFFKDWDCFDAVGIEEQPLNKVGFDTKENLIDKANIIALPAPAYGSFKTSVAKDMLFNELEIGYPEIKDEVGLLNGKEEFNCKFLFSTGTTKNPARLDKVSKIIAGCYPIEKVRVTTLSKDTTDNKADNDLFSVYVEPILGEQLLFSSTESYEITMSGAETILLTPIGFGSTLQVGYKVLVDGAGPYTVKQLVLGATVMNVYLWEHPSTVSPTTGILSVYGVIPSNLDRSLNPSITAGVLETETVFNLALTPGRSIRRQGSYLRSLGWAVWDNKTLGYRTADRNNKLICDGIEEKADIPISTLNAAFFKPVILEGDFEAPFDLLELLDNNPKQIYSFVIEGTTYYGLLLQVSTAISSNKIQSYRFLSDSSNNLTNLINYAG